MTFAQHDDYSSFTFRSAVRHALEVAQGLVGYAALDVQSTCHWLTTGQQRELGAARYRA